MEAVGARASPLQCDTLGALNMPGEQGLPGVLWFMYFCKVTPNRVKKRRAIKRATTWNAFLLFPPHSICCPGLWGEKKHQRLAPEVLSFPLGCLQRTIAGTTPSLPVLVENSRYFGIFKGGFATWLSYQLIVPAISEFIKCLPWCRLADKFHMFPNKQLDLLPWSLACVLCHVLFPVISVMIIGHFHFIVFWLPTVQVVLDLC